MEISDLLYSLNECLLELQQSTRDLIRSCVLWDIFNRVLSNLSRLAGFRPNNARTSLGCRILPEISKQRQGLVKLKLTELFYQIFPW